MKLGHIELFVKDPVAASDFYIGTLGFERTAEQPGGFTWLKCGETEILLRPGEPPKCGESYRQASSALVLYTDDRPRTVATLLERGLRFHGIDGADIIDKSISKIDAVRQ